MEEHEHRLPVLHVLWQQLAKNWSREAHWFCPKRRDDDPLNYDNPEVSEDEAEDENVTFAQKAKLFAESEERLKTAYKIFELHIYEMADMEATLLDARVEHRSRSQVLLTTCDRCVRNYHMGRKHFLKEFSEYSPDYRVKELSDFLDTWDFMRIDEGLDTAQKLLKEVSLRERSAKALMTDTTALTALYEALCSAQYHTSEMKLHSKFDAPFQLVQERRVLKIGDILPAMTRFLFDTDYIRLRFANAAWHDLDRKLTQKTFDWAIHDALTDAITSVSQPTASVSVVLQFWQGLLLILHKLDKELITHSLRAMEVYPDVYHLALQHLARYDSEEILENVIKALRVLLQKSPKDFYAAYDAISATTIAEQIFANRAFEGLLARSHQYELIDDIEVPSALTWISPLVQSLPAAHQYEICRSLLHHLFERFQAKNLTKASKLACFRAGLKALLTTLITFVASDYKINDSTPFIVVNNVLGLVKQYRTTVVDCANLGSSNDEDKELTRLGMQVIRNALSLCCKSTLAEFEALDSKKDIRHGLDSHSQSIWEAVLDGFRRNNIEMARNVLSGLHSFVGLDKLKPKGRAEKATSVEDPLLKCKLRFNFEFVQVVEVISRVYERLSDFTPSILQPLCQKAATAYSIFAGLTPPDQATYEATVEIIKAITGESARKDAVARLLQDSLSVTLRSLAWATHRVSKYGSFSALPFLLKTSRDVLDGLCDPQDGLLRTKLSPSKEEQGMIVAWWKEQWGAMSTAFQNYENWASGNKAEHMIDICRDVMEYVEALFDQYVVLASILDDSALSIDPKIDRSELSRTSRKSLLEHPRETMQYLLVWLRLKDPYLLSTLVSLVCKILRRLGEFDMGINETALHDVEKLATGGFPKYKVTQLQRAELQSALEEHIGMEIVAETKSFVDFKPGAVDARFKYSYGARKDGTTISSPSSMSDDVRSLSKSIEQRKSTLDQIRSRQGAKFSSDSSSKKIVAALPNLKESREKAKEDKMRRDASFLAEERAKRVQSGRIQGEGSGLSGIGVQGKDHGPVPKESSVMVSDGESSEDDGSEAKALLIGSREKAKKVSERGKTMKRALLQEPAGPVRKTKINRSAGDKRARIVPNMDILHLSILRWDIFHEGDEPPGDVDFQEVSNTFQTAAEYYKTFYPLLIAEAWRSLSTAREESNFKPFDITVVNRLTVDKFFEVGTSMPIAENRDNNLAEGDIILLSKSESPMKDRKTALCLSRVSKVSRKKDSLEVSYRIPVPATGSTALLSNFSPNLKIRGVKITSMITIEREYAALNSLLYYDLCDEILSAKPSPLLSYPKQTFNQITTIYGLNEGQAKAIWSARDNDGFTLIQGPPGSGKTKTIVALVGALLTDKFSAPGVPISHPRVGPAKIQQEMPMQKKLLICAPSNAAVDELVTRLKKGIKTLKGDFQKINVIRLGRSDAINSNVKDVTLDELVRAKMEGDGKSGSIVASKRDKMHQEAGELKEAVNVLRTKIEEARSSGNDELERRLQRELDGKKRDQARIGAMIEDDKTNGNSASRENEITRRRLQQEIVDSAHVLCATLSGSGHEMFKHLDVEFETVIIDEAAQCIELSAIIPLKYGCSKCILVGDPKQLPPTVLSKSAARYGYEQSLFVRMQQNHPNDVHLLDVQYRMHPEISKFPSNQFYDGKLIDGDGLAKLRNMPWHTGGILGPYRFFNVKGTQVNGAKGHSFINMEEVRDALRLYHRLRSECRSYDFRGKIGIITPYKAQLKELRRAFQSSCGEKVFDEIDFNTTDAFQGRESEIIIFSCVRARASGGIGFLEDVRRMNVGLTRAKSSLWILGDSRSLMQGEFWARLIEDAKARHLFSEGIIEQETSLTMSNPASRSVEGPRPNTADVGHPAVTASIEMTSKPPSRRDSIVSVEMDDIFPSRRTSTASSDMVICLDEREDSVLSDNSTFRADSIAFSASGASTPSLPLDNRSLGQSSAKAINRNSFEQKEQIGMAVQDRGKDQSVERFTPKNPSRISREGKGLWFNGTAIRRRTGSEPNFKKDVAVTPSTLDGNVHCNVCGSSAHFTIDCGDVVRLKAKGLLCNRCQKPPAHATSDCTVPRCLCCGKYDHTEADCEGQRLNKANNKHLIKEEDAFEHKKASHQPQPQTASGQSGVAPWSYDGNQKGFKNGSKHARTISPGGEDIVETTQFKTESKGDDCSDKDTPDFGNAPSAAAENSSQRQATNPVLIRPTIASVPPPRKKARVDPLIRNKFPKRQ